MRLRGLICACLIAAVSCSTDDAAETDVSDDTAQSAAVQQAADAAPPASAAECGRLAEPTFSHGIEGGPTVVLPALPGWSVDDSVDHTAALVLSNGTSAVSVDVTEGRGSVGAELDTAKAAIESLPGWNRTSYRVGTVCGHPAVAESGSADLVIGAHLFGHFVVAASGDRQYLVTVIGQSPDPDAESFAGDFPIMVQGLRIRG